MLFVFLVDEDVEMKNLVLGTQMTDLPSSFQATSLDGALYFVECFSKVKRNGLQMAHSLTAHVSLELVWWLW